MQKYNGIAEATEDVLSRVNRSQMLNHPFSSPALSVTVPAWTNALSGFEARTTVTPREEVELGQIRSLYYTQEEWLAETAEKLEIGELNEHEPAKVLFMGLFRDLQLRFGPKQNLNPHKLAVLLGERYEVNG